ncbi:MAG: hypothetical protein C0483_01290 [Pirellula sp.]|nr:hypothetical protein [Pirellula sp.]
MGRFPSNQPAEVRLPTLRSTKLHRESPMPSKVNGSKKLKSPAKAARPVKPAAKKAKPEVKSAKSVKPAAKPVAAKAAVKEAPKSAAAKGKEAVKAKDAKLKDVKAKDAAKVKEPKPPKEPTKRKRKGAGVIRLKAYWGVFNQGLKRVAVFEYAERKNADKKAADLSVSSKQPHFVQLVKEIIRDAE